MYAVASIEHSVCAADCAAGVPANCALDGDGARRTRHDVHREHTRRNRRRTGVDAEPATLMLERRLNPSATTG